MRDNRRFNRSGMYVCSDCGKKTRETGSEESSVGLCKKCYKINVLENQFADGKITEEELNARLAKIK
jgi:hypothetical protein